MKIEGAEEIRITDIPGIRVGHAERPDAGSGCTVILAEEGLLTSCDVRGGGPATRNTTSLEPSMANERLYGIVLTGGSAYGLDACTGVMDFLEEKGIGTRVREWKIPVVAGAAIFDFPVTNALYRPDAALGYEAAANAWSAPASAVTPEGCVGAGTGATVSKYRGLGRCVKSGLGIYALRVGELVCAAVVCVNAFGDIYDPETGRQITGPLTEDGKGFLCTEELLLRDFAAGSRAKKDAGDESGAGNTTIGAVITNARLTKGQLCKAAGLAQNGIARTVRPSHTTRDGDTVFAMTSGTVDAPVDTVGILAGLVMSKAIIRGVEQAVSMKGFKAVRDLKP